MREPALPDPSFVRRWIRRLPESSSLIALSVAYALGGALIAIAFQVAMTWVYRHGLLALSSQSPGVFLGSSFALVVGTAAIAGWLLHAFSPEAAGSGIPQLKRAFWKDFGIVSKRVLWVKFAAASLQIGGGSSLGREGPSVQLAGAAASNLATVLGVAKQRHRRAAATGAASGLAAAFNTPLAAVTFVLEEIIGDLNSRLMGGILLAAMVGALVVHAILGPQPAFTLAPVGEPAWKAQLLVPIVAAAAAIVGSAFQAGSLGLRGMLRQHRPPVPRWLLPAIGATVCWGLGAAVFLRTGRMGVFGLGYEDLSDALAGRLAWGLAGVLLLAKFAATVACYGTGGCGGIFSPTLFFGAMAGVVVGGLARNGLGLGEDGNALLAIVGMSASLGAVVRAPVTSILIVFEMTHEFALVPPLMLAALVSQAVSRRLLHENFYDALLAQDNQSVEHVALPRDLRSWQDQPVSRFSAGEPVIASSLNGASLRELLERYPYQRFPVIFEGRVQGLLLRTEVETAQREGREPRTVEALTCKPETKVREAANQLVASSAGLLVIQSDPAGPVNGVFTLHDLLRAQIAAADYHASLET